MLGPARSVRGSPHGETTLASLIAQAPLDAPVTRARRRSCWRRWVPDLLAVGLCLVALVGAAWVSTTVFERLPHVEDEVAYLFQARTFAAGRLVADAPPHPDFFDMPFVMVRDGMWFGKYLPGYPAVLALGVLAGQPWLLNPVLGALAVGLVYLAGRRLYGAPTGLLAAALMTISPFFLLQSGSFMSHTACLVWALAFLLLFERARRPGGWWASLVAGGALGMLVLSRPFTAAAYALPFALWAGVEVVRRPRRVLLYLPLTLVFLFAVVGMLAYNKLTTGDPLLTAYELYWPFDRIGFGEGIGSNGRHTWADGKLNTRLHLASLRGYLYGWPWQLSVVPLLLGAGLAVLGLAWRGLRKLGARSAECGVPGTASDASVTSSAPVPRSPPASGSPVRAPSWPEAWDLLHCGVVVSLVVAHAAYWYGQQVYGPRYYFEALGALALLSARGLLGVSGLIGLALRRVLPRWRRANLWAAAVVLLVVAGLTAHSFGNFAPQEFRRFARWYNVDADDLRRVRTAGIHDAVVFVAQRNWTDYAPFYVQHAPALDADVVYAIDHGDERNRALMALYPGRAFYRYADGRLTPLPGP